MKFMNMKRFGSVVMAGALALSLTVPAFADPAPSPSTPVGEVTVTGAYKEIPISVVVPTTGTAQLNPYGLPVNVAIAEDAVTPITGQKITTQPLSIKNIGTVKLDVKGTLLVTPKGDVSIAASKGANADGTSKTIAVSLEVVGLNDEKYKVSAEKESLVFDLNAAFADEATWASKQTLAAPAYAKGGTAPAAAKSTNAMATLGAATINGDVITFGKDSIALFRLTGDLNEEPVKAATAPATGTEDFPWTTTDGFEAKVAFKFTPHQDVAASVTLDKTTTTIASSGTDTITATYNAGDSGLTVTKYDWASDDTSKATVVAGGTASATSTTVTNAGAGTANVTVTVTLSDGSTVTATCAVTCS